MKVMKLFTINKNALLLASSFVNRISTSAVFNMKMISTPTDKSNNVKLIKRTGYGVNNFKELIEQSNTFIDKSLLIRDFLNDSAKVLRITYPRRWGKTINISMIKTFLEIQFDKNGMKYQDKTQTSNYKLFRETKFKIANDEDIMTKYQGEYPVILVSFKNVIGNDYEELVEELKEVLQELFKQYTPIYRSLLKSAIQSYNNCYGTTYDTEDDNINYLEMIVEDKKIRSPDLLLFKRFYNNKELSISDIQYSLEFLSEILHNHFGKTVYILVDEYDTPINNILQSGNFSKESLNETFMLFQGIMEITFKENAHLEKGFITGIVKILTNSSILASFNNLWDYNFLTSKFAKHYGFTEDEVNYLFKEYEISEEKQIDAKNWYNGYLCADRKNLKIYNPWSIISFLLTGRINNYWVKSGGIDFLDNLLKIEKIRKKIELLIDQKYNEINKLDTSRSEQVFVLNGLNFSEDDCLILKELLKNNDNFKIDYLTVELFLRLIFCAGYLTLAEENIQGYVSCVKIPNREILYEFENRLSHYYETSYYSTDFLDLLKNISDKLTNLFNNDDINELKSSLEELLKVSPDPNNIKDGKHANEDLIHSIINIIALKIKRYKFGTEVWHKNQARGEIVFVSNDLPKIGMIIKVEYAAKSLEKVIEQVKKYKVIFNDRKDVKQFKCIIINVTEERKVVIHIIKD